MVSSFFETQIISEYKCILNCLFANDFKTGNAAGGGYIHGGILSMHRDVNSLVR